MNAYRSSIHLPCHLKNSHVPVLYLQISCFVLASKSTMSSKWSQHSCPTAPIQQRIGPLPGLGPISTQDIDMSIQRAPPPIHSSRPISEPQFHAESQTAWVQANPRNMQSTSPLSRGKRIKNWFKTSASRLWVLWFCSLACLAILITYCASRLQEETEHGIS